LQHGDERYIKASAIGIVECPGCEGRGVVEVKHFGMFTCDDCHGHKWIREEHGDDL